MNDNVDLDAILVELPDKTYVESRNLNVDKKLRKKMQRIIFETPTIIDPNAFKVFGLSAKETENPIGFFGTGLKYAIAIILRLDGKISIHSGDEKYEFRTEKKSFRDKEFDAIFCNEEQLSYTTELGKTWEPWQAFRELYCNTLDENGEVFEVKTSNPLKNFIRIKGKTVIEVECEEIIKIFHQKEKYFIEDQDKMLFDHKGVQFYENTKEKNGNLFYQGVLVGNLDPSLNRRSTAFYYNFIRPVALSEDRTLQNEYYEMNMVADIFATLVERDAIKKVLQTWRSNNLEKDLEYPVSPRRYSPQFLEAAIQFLKESQESTPVNVQRAIYTHQSETSSYEHIILNPRQKTVYEDAAKFVKDFGYWYEEANILFVKTLGENTLAFANQETRNIVLSEKLLDSGRKLVALALIEEMMHLRDNLHDCSRAMQTHLLNQIVTLGEEKLGVVL